MIIFFCVSIGIAVGFVVGLFLSAWAINYGMEEKDLCIYLDGKWVNGKFPPEDAEGLRIVEG